MKTLIKILIVLITINIINLYSENESAGFNELTCPRVNFATPILNLCWRCVFPIQIGRSNISNWVTRTYHEQNWNNISSFRTPNDYFCLCEDNGRWRFGLVVTMWYPVKLIEIVRKRWCFMILNGWDGMNALDNNLLQRYRYAWGSRGTTGNSNLNKFFYNAHLYVYPVFDLLEMILAPECLPGGFSEFAQILLSEYDPTWNNDKLALLTNPEALAFANPLSVMACSADAVATSTGFGLETLFWCNGSQLLYPLTGNIDYSVSPVREAFHLAARITAKAFRLGFLRKTIGDSAICGSDIYPFLIKEQFRLQMIYPEGREITGKCCVPFGRNTFVSDWERRTLPAGGEDFMFVVFQKITCCVGKYLN